MGIKKTLAWPFAKYLERKVLKDSKAAIETQKQIFNTLIKKGSQTRFGKDHNFQQVKSVADYQNNVPPRDYEALKHYFELAKKGEEDILWPGKPRYFAKTSGTTSGAKYIPITSDSLPNHFGTARNALFNFYGKYGKGNWMDGKMIFLSGSPELDTINGIHVGRLSGISNHLIPNWLKSSQLPSYETNIIEDWEDKLDAIVKETVGQDLRLISGIPPWVQMYFERLLEYTGKKNILEVFPNFSVFVYGGVNYEPYRQQMEALIGKRIESVETYPASEGFIAFQDGKPGEGLLLNTNSGIFFEFIPLQEYGSENPRRLTLEEVEIGVNYALILSTNAGLWAYDIGDTIEFLSTEPYRIKVSGRVKHYISAFGEHVIGKEVETSLNNSIAKHGGKVTEFTVAPQVSPIDSDTPYHEWFIEFAEEPKDLSQFSETLDFELRKQNIYYEDLRSGNVLSILKLNSLPANSFRKYMQQNGKLGGQNKVPRLSNNRKIAEVLNTFKS